jgi:hypothetical protein
MLRPCKFCGTEAGHCAWRDELCPKHYHTRVVVKFNGGKGALLCNSCHVIVADYLSSEELKGHTYLIRCEKHIAPHKYIMKWWTREEVAADPTFTYVFGDNAKDAKSGYTPHATQAVIRGLPNAIGIATKKDRGSNINSFFNEEDYDEFAAHLNAAADKIRAARRPLALPYDGIGTGAAMLYETSPKCFALLNLTLRELLYECSANNRPAGN